MAFGSSTPTPPTPAPLPKQPVIDKVRTNKTAEDEIKRRKGAAATILTRNAGNTSTLRNSSSLAVKELLGGA